MGQWRDELFEKFGLEFRVYSGELDERLPVSDLELVHGVGNPSREGLNFSADARDNLRLARMQ